MTERNLEQFTLTFRVVNLGQKAEEGAIGIGASVYQKAKKEIAAESWRRDSKSPIGGIRKLHPSMYGTYVDFIEAGGKKIIRVTSTTEGAARSIASKYSLKQSFNY